MQQTLSPELECPEAADGSGEVVEERTRSWQQGTPQRIQVLMLSVIGRQHRSIEWSFRVRRLAASMMLPRLERRGDAGAGVGAGAGARDALSAGRWLHPSVSFNSSAVCLLSILVYFVSSYVLFLQANPS